MMSCEKFLAQFTASTEDAALLDHARTCDACLAHAAEIDPDIVFRAIGGQELLPPGGVDAFVDDVMREVRLRSTETSFAPRRASWTRRLAIAATIAIGIIGAVAVYRIDTVAPPAQLTIARATVPRPNLTTGPVVETYDSETATIVEVPTEGVGDVKVVMVFDETLPADL